LEINEPTITNAKLQQKSRYVCCNCYEKHGGHLYVKPGKGKPALQCNHNEDTNMALQLMGNWIINLSYSNNDLLKTNILTRLTTIIEQLLNYIPPPVSSENNTNSSDSIISMPYSLFGTKVFLDYTK